MSVTAIGNRASNYALEPPLLTRTAEGWDQVRELVRLSTGAGGLTLGASRSPTGVDGTFFIYSARETGCQLGMKIVEIISRGLHSAKGYVAEPTSYTEAVQGVLAGVPGAPTVATAQIQIPRVGVNVRWLSTTAPDATVVGTLLSPPEDFGVPAYPVTPADGYKLYHYPYEWYLAKRDSTRLPLTNYHLVQDYYIYQPNPTFTGN